MISEAPKEIFLTNCEYEEAWDWPNPEGIYWSASKVNDNDIEYIRKDIYDKVVATLKYYATEWKETK